MSTPSATVAGRSSSRPAAARIPFMERSAEWRNGYASGYRARMRNFESRAVRWTPEGPELRCANCSERGGVTAFWPITEEFWNPRNLKRCKACNLALKRQKAKAAYWADPETHRRLAHDYYRRHAKVIRLKQRARHAQNPAADWERSKAYQEAHRDALRAYRRAYYAKNRERILFREKLRRAGVLVKAA